MILSFISAPITKALLIFLRHRQSATALDKRLQQLKADERRSRSFSPSRTGAHGKDTSKPCCSLHPEVHTCSIKSRQQYRRFYADIHTYMNTCTDRCSLLAAGPSGKRPQIRSVLSTRGPGTTATTTRPKMRHAPSTREVGPPFFQLSQSD